MQVDLNNSVFWHELGIEFSNNLNQNIDKFYVKYQKTLRDLYAFPRDRSQSVNLLLRKIRTDKEFLLEVFLSDLERGIKSPQLSIIRDNDFDINSLNRYSRLLIMRLNKLNKTERLYYKAEPYPSPFYRESANKIWFVLKKGTGKAIRLGKRKGIYKKYPDYVIIITRKGDHWILRSSFHNISERRVIKKVFNSKKVVLSKEDSIDNLFSKIKEESKIKGVDGSFSKETKDFGYSFLSEEGALNGLVDQDFENLFGNEHNLEQIKNIVFNIANQDIHLKIIPHKFNVKHIKLVTTGLNPNQILEISRLLKEKFDIEEDIYFLKAEDKYLRRRYILDSNKIEESDLFILKDDLEFLCSKGLITMYYTNSFKFCLNKDCSNYEDKIIFDKDEELCPNCDQKLVRFGASGKISRNHKKMNDYLVEAFIDNGLDYKGKLKKSFNKKEILFDKFSYNGQDFLFYLHKDGNLRELLEKFSERSLPVIVGTTKKDIANNLEFDNFSVEKVVFTDLFIEYEDEKKLNIDFLEELESKKWSLRNHNFIQALRTLRLFHSTNFNMGLLSGRTIQRKGNHFERLINQIFKMISNSWIELGQTFQNQSVSDGLGYLRYGNKNYVFGIDAKLKGNSRYSRGLTTTERDNQVKYISDCRRQARGYGGLKSWVIVVKSEGDYPKFKNSLKKLINESHFSEIKLLSLESLFKVCEFYQKVISEDVINKEAFSELMYKLIKYKGDITLEKVKRISDEIPELKKFSISF